MKQEIWLFIYSIIVTIIFIAITGCSDSTGSDKNNSEQNEEPSVYVKTEPLQLVSFIDNIYVLGVAKAMYHSNISSDEGGRIKEFIKDKGSYVKKGDVILTIDNEVLKASLDAAFAQYQKAESTYVRQEIVYNQKVTSELTYLNSKFERDAAKANFKLIKARYDRTFVKAPFGGIVDQKFAEIGETVMPGFPIVSLVSMNKIKVVAGVPENYVNKVHKGSKVKIVFKDLNSAQYESKVSYVGYTISTDNRTFPIEIILANRDKKIKPELSAKIFIEEASYENVFVIPEETVTETDLGSVVFVEKDGIAEMRVVEILSRSKNEIAVKSGLSEGENLVVVGFQNLVNGKKVTVINSDEK
ncbi:MAG: efflux RND transporter periplasmic adaptor subunit [Ignavibacteriaceae bacterium]